MLTYRQRVAWNRVAKPVAAALLAGAWTERALSYRLEKLAGAKTRSAQRDLISKLVQRAPGPVPPRPHDLMAFLVEEPSFRKALAPLAKPGVRAPVVLSPPRFAPAERFRDLEIPKLATIGALVDWLDISISDLDWLADTRRLQSRADNPLLQHYVYSFGMKRIGPPRLIEAPKPRLKAIQRRILSDILDKVPAHPAAHGFVRERSCLTGAAAHAGEDIVLTVDLKDFFLKTRVARVHALFHTLGYPEQTARALTGLTTTATPLVVFRNLPERVRHSRETQLDFNGPHLPQGAPTSPALANLAAFSLDSRIAGLARRFGVTYTRYADDLAFSGGGTLQKRAASFLSSLADIAADEGYALHPAKTHLMTRATRQQVTGIVVNECVNIDREAVDRLKAILTNCARHGPASQNRHGVGDFRAHLAGRIAWIEHVNQARGAKLRQIYERIDWRSA